MKLPEALLLGRAQFSIDTLAMDVRVRKAIVQAETALADRRLTQRS